MRKLNQIIDAGFMSSDDGLFTTMNEVLALDENGELWHGTIESTDDDRRVVDWTPINTPKDGAGFTEPQLSFFDKWEREANERLKADAKTSGKIVSLAKKTKDDAKRSGETVQDSSDDSVENGEGTNPG